MGVSDAAIAAIHHSGRQMVLAITGGGASAIGALLRVPGGSQSVLAALVPYSWPALVEFLGGKPDQACSPQTARAMAMASWCRARALAAEDVTLERLVGVGCTASLASDRPKRGPHRVHVAVQTLDETSTYSLDLEKGARTRADEEALAANLLLAELARACGVDDRVELGLRSVETVVVDRHAATDPWRALMRGDVQWVGNALAERFSPGQPLAVFSGAFNPFHAGHQTMVDVAKRRLKQPLALEISLLNVDKPPLNYTDLHQRTASLPAELPYFLTRAPTFVEKADLFPHATFVVGADTIERIGQPRYYAHDVMLRDQALATLAARGCRFLVFGRTTAGGFQTLSDLELPSRLRTLCDEVPREEFHVDISSTELRRKRAD